MPLSLKVIPKTSFVAAPWKNGGGVTHEAIRSPAQGDAFQWRLSLAEIDTDGPFSNFTGYQRFMALIKGEGVALEFADGESVELRELGAAIRFDGGRSPFCRLLRGPCTDLNFMIQASLRCRCEIETLRQERLLELAENQTLLIFSLQESLTLQVAGLDSTIHPWDLAIASGAAARIGIKKGFAERNALVFFAVINH